MLHLCHAVRRCRSLEIAELQSPIFRHATTPCLNQALEIPRGHLYFLLSSPKLLFGRLYFSKCRRILGNLSTKSNLAWPSMHSSYLVIQLVMVWLEGHMSKTNNSKICVNDVKIPNCPHFLIC